MLGRRFCLLGSCHFSGSAILNLKKKWNRATSWEYQAISSCKINGLNPLHRRVEGIQVFVDVSRIGKGKISIAMLLSANYLICWREVHINHPQIRWAKFNLRQLRYGPNASWTNHDACANWIIFPKIQVKKMQNQCKATIKKHLGSSSPFTHPNSTVHPCLSNAEPQTSWLPVPRSKMAFNPGWGTVFLCSSWLWCGRLPSCYC